MKWPFFGKSERIAQLENDTARLRLAHRQLGIRAKIISKFMGGAPQGSFPSELYPDPEKTRNGLARYTPQVHATNEKLRRMSRMVEFSSPTAAALLGRFVDLVIGSGLRLQAEPVWSIIGGRRANDREYQRAWVKNTEARYRMWARDYDAGYDLKHNLYQIDRKAFEYKLRDGEYFLVLRYAATGRKNPLTIQIIPPENVQSGDKQPAHGNTLENGIEYDATGRAVAYHIYDDKTGHTTRIPRFGSKSGRIFVIHNFLATDEKQRRGVPFLANAIHELMKLGDYEILEIQAAIVNALYAVWIEPPSNEDGQPIINKGTFKKSEIQQSQSTPSPTEEYLEQLDQKDYSQGGVVLDALPAGHKPHSFDTKRPNAGFNVFFDAVKKNIASAKGMALSVLDIAFNESYSGARGELLILWNAINRMRENHGWDFEDDIYKMWMWGEVLRGTIDAPGFEDPEIRRAYCNATWNGMPLPNIDPLKLVNAHVIEQKHGYQTGHQIAAEYGNSDYDENLNIVTEELKKAAAAQEPLERIKQAKQQAGGGNQPDQGAE